MVLMCSIAAGLLRVDCDGHLEADGAVGLRQARAGGFFADVHLGGKGLR